jgi:hypothetical protein
MKKIIMSVIGLAIALALVVAIWVPLANKSRGTAQTNYTRTTTIDSNVQTISAEVNATSSTTTTP